MDETHNRQHRATYINSDLRKAQSDIARGPGLLNIHKTLSKGYMELLKKLLLKGKSSEKMKFLRNSVL